MFFQASAELIRMKGLTGEDLKRDAIITYEIFKSSKNPINALFKLLHRAADACLAHMLFVYACVSAYKFLHSDCLASPFQALRRHL